MRKAIQLTDELKFSISTDQSDDLVDPSNATLHLAQNFVQYLIDNKHYLASFNALKEQICSNSESIHFFGVYIYDRIRCRTYPFMIKYIRIGIGKDLIVKLNLSNIPGQQIMYKLEEVFKGNNILTTPVGRPDNDPYINVFIPLIPSSTNKPNFILDKVEFRGDFSISSEYVLVIFSDASMYNIGQNGGQDTSNWLTDPDFISKDITNLVIEQGNEFGFIASFDPTPDVNFTPPGMTNWWEIRFTVMSEPTNTVYCSPNILLDGSQNNGIIQIEEGLYRLSISSTVNDDLGIEALALCTFVNGGIFTALKIDNYKRNELNVNLECTDNTLNILSKILQLKIKTDSSNGTINYLFEQSGEEISSGGPFDRDSSLLLRDLFLSGDGQYRLTITSSEDNGISGDDPVVICDNEGNPLLTVDSWNNGPLIIIIDCQNGVISVFSKRVTLKLDMDNTDGTVSYVLDQNDNQISSGGPFNRDGSLLLTDIILLGDGQYRLTITSSEDNGIFGDDPVIICDVTGNPLLTVASWNTFELVIYITCQDGVIDVCLPIDSWFFDSEDLSSLTFVNSAGPNLGWQIWSQPPVVPGPISNPSVLYYGDPNNNNFNFGVSNGTATTPTKIYGGSVKLLLYMYLDTEESPIWDQPSIIIVNGTRTVIWDKTFPTVRYREWFVLVLNVTLQPSDTLAIELNFDTIDGAFNEGLGVLVDNILICLQ